MPLFTAQANKLIDHQLGKTAYSLPQIYVALTSTTPSIDGTGITEPSTGSYARVATTGATWNAAASGQSSNAAKIEFPAATADWSSAATFSYFVLFDAATSGNKIGYGTIATPKNCLNGDQLVFNAGQLTITVTG